VACRISRRNGEVGNKQDHDQDFQDIRNGWHNCNEKRR